MLKAVGKTIAAVAAALAAALLALNGARMVTVPSRVLLAAVVISAVLAAFTTSAASRAEWRSRRAGAQKTAAEFQLTSTLWAIVDQTAAAGPATEPIDYRDLGLAVYRCRRRWWWPGAARLVRQNRVRASHRPGISDVVWRPGKGVIGRCVETGSMVAVDVSELYETVGDPDPQDWAEAPQDVTMGLDYGEYLDLRDKYEVVVAVPMADEGGATTKVVGCVALDGPCGRLETLTTAEITDLLANLVRGLTLPAA